MSSPVDDQRISVLINASCLMTPFTGIAHYTRSLSAALADGGELDVTYFYYTTFSRKLRDAPLPGIESARRAFKAVVPMPYTVKRALQAAAFFVGTRTRRFDIYHEPNFLSFKFRGPTVMAAHDLSWIRFPMTHPADRVKVMNELFPRALKLARHIVTPSEFVRQEIINEFDVPPSSVTVTPYAARAGFLPIGAERAGATLRRAGLSHRNFLLCVGTLEPRKNIESAVRAYLGLSPRLQQRFPLVLAGMQGWLGSALSDLVGPLEARGSVRRLGYLDDESLTHVVSSARMLIYPSLYEGFGLPPLEAMASGTPVVTSNVSSLPEVVGDAGIQVDPHDVDALREAIRRLAEDDSQWEALRSAGLARAAQFSWARCARETLAVYRKVLA